MLVEKQKNVYLLQLFSNTLMEEFQNLETRRIALLADSRNKEKGKCIVNWVHFFLCFINHLEFENIK